MKLSVNIVFSEDDLFDFMYSQIHKEFLKVCIKERLKNGLQEKNDIKRKPKTFSAVRRCKKT